MTILQIKKGPQHSYIKRNTLYIYIYILYLTMLFNLCELLNLIANASHQPQPFCSWWSRRWSSDAEVFIR